MARAASKTVKMFFNMIEKKRRIVVISIGPVHTACAEFASSTLYDRTVPHQEHHHGRRGGYE